MKNQKNWDEVYSKSSIWYPMMGIVKLAARYIQRRLGVNKYDKRKEVKRILDAGCGNGNHLVFFLEQGFREVYGIDISEHAINLAGAWLASKNLEAELAVGDIETLPYHDKFFDLVVSHGVFDHISFDKAKKAMEAIKRVLSPKGYVFLTLRSTETSEFGRGAMVEKNTFRLAEGYEKGLIQHFFDLEEIKQLLRGFKIFDIELVDERYPSVFTLDKSFLESSQGMKKYLDLNMPLDLNLKESRWYIAAEKNR